MGNFTKTVKLRIRDPNKGKKEKIEEAMDQSLKCANEAVKRLPGLENYDVKRQSGTIYNIVKDLRNDGVSLNSQCAYQAVEKARESYLSGVMNGNYDTVPKFENEFVGLHNRDNIDGFFEKGGTYYVTLKLFPFEKIVLPFFPGDYQDYFLEKITSDDIDYGSGEIVRNDFGYTLNLSIKKPVDLDYEPETFIGVDLGLNVLSWAVALDGDGDFLDEVHFDGGEAGHIRKRYWKLRKELQESGKIDKEKEIGSKEQRWMENKNHVISRRIVDFAEQFDKPIILLEDINVNQLRKKADNTRIHSWTAGKLRDFIQYKAEEAEIKTKLVNPKNTSRECPDCGHVSNKNREGIDFQCNKCNYKNHADFVGSLNIATRGY